MADLVIRGGNRLSGRIAVEGNKNAALPLLAACLLTSETCELRNVPRIRDVAVMIDLLRSLGATVEGEGTADGVKEGTEADPLKARAVSQYYGKLQGWFNARFRPPSEGAPCAELKKLGASVVVTVGGDRSVAGYSLVKPSGNSDFDARVRAMLDGAKGGPEAAGEHQGGNDGRAPEFRGKQRPQARSL